MGTGNTKVSPSRKDYNFAAYCFGVSALGCCFAAISARVGLGAATFRGAAFFAGLALAFFKIIFFLATGFFFAAERALTGFLGFAIANLTSRVVTPKNRKLYLNFGHLSRSQRAPLRL